MEEDRNRGFWKGFWIGFGIFFASAVVIAGTLLWSMLYGLERMAARKEETRPTQEEEPKGDTEAADRFQEVMDYVDAYFVLDYDKP